MSKIRRSDFIKQEHVHDGLYWSDKVWKCDGRDFQLAPKLLVLSLYYFIVIIITLVLLLLLLAVFTVKAVRLIYGLFGHFVVISFVCRPHSFLMSTVPSVTNEKIFLYIFFKKACTLIPLCAYSCQLGFWETICCQISTKAKGLSNS